MTLNHARVRSHNQLDHPISSNKEYEIHVGFRKFSPSCLFSQIYGGTDKLKMVKKLKPSPHWYQVSYYAPIVFGQANFLLFDQKEVVEPPSLIGSLC